MKKANVIYEKAYEFAIRIVKAYQYLNKEKKEFVLSKQLLRSGTSIGANISEANGAVSKVDFSNKISITTKSASRQNIGFHYSMTQISLIKAPLKVSTQLRMKPGKSYFQS